MSNTDAADTLLACSGLVKRYREGANEVSVLSGVDLQLVKGQRLAIMGTSGSGKTTLLNVLGGLDRPDSGVVEIRGRNIAAMGDDELSRFRNEQLGFVYQFHHLLPEFDARENVAMPLFIGGMHKDEAFQRADNWLRRVGLSARGDHRPSELSGGERQRVAIARALVNQPACVLMDEPTGNLDQATTREIVAVLHEVADTVDTALLVVTHDESIAAEMDQCLTLQSGTLVANQ